MKKFNEEKQALKLEIEQLHEKLIDSKTQRRSGSLNGPSGDDDFEDAQSKITTDLYRLRLIAKICFRFNLIAGEANKVIADYKYKLTKAEQEIASLQASLARSETQVIRYKSTADATEKAESELKIERRKLQREVNVTKKTWNILISFYTQIYYIYVALLKATFFLYNVYLNITFFSFL